jgi:uncharacterized protein (DUF1800 family)
MRNTASDIDPKWAWEPYRPSAKEPWNAQRVGHLYRRACFGATFKELEAGVSAGPEALIQSLCAGDTARTDYDQTMEPLAESIGKANNAQQLRAWWLNRMLYSPHPLQEKMTLFWHNHFATSNAKVLNAGFMLSQYRLLRRHAMGNFSAMLHEISVKDPAMMVWLDTRDSKKGNPNENYARELMELFSLGIGNYTEMDIREAARAFTGFEITGNDIIYNAKQHDEGEKTVLGKKGNFKADDIVDICLAQQVCPRFITRKLFRWLVSETIPATPELIDPLADQFKASGFDFGALVKTVLRSNLFFAPAAYRSKIKMPVEFGLGIVRGLEGRIGTTALAQALEGLGQNVFFPPSVKGWDGGQTWLNGQTLLFRQNLALALSSTEDVRFGSRIDPVETAKKYGKDEADLVEFFLKLFLQDDVPAETRQRLVDYTKKAQVAGVPVYWTAEDAAKHRIRTLCHLVLTQPEFQLC